MINKNWIIVILAVVVAALIAGFWWWDHSKLKKQSANWQAQYEAVKNAPADTVIRYDSIYVQGGTLIKPVPYKVIEYDTVIMRISQSWYDSVYKGDGWRFRYRAKVTGSLDYIEFSDLVAPVTVKYITRHIDTCILKPTAYKPMLLHWGVYGELVTDNFTEFPGIGLGGQIILNDRLTIGLGGLYLDGFKGSLRVGVLLR